MEVGSRCAQAEGGEIMSGRMGEGLVRSQRPSRGRARSACRHLAVICAGYAQRQSCTVYPTTAVSRFFAFAAATALILGWLVEVH